MKLCSWASGCAQETSGDTDVCEYHAKVSDGLLHVSGEVGKVAARKELRRPSSDRRRPNPPDA
ncbi:MAG: hypothetical protein ACXWXQ_10010 [Actinomycetota bacterium]